MTARTHCQDRFSLRIVVRPCCAIACCVMLCVLLSSCRRLPLPRADYALSPVEKPDIGIQYFPYGRSMDRTIAEPLPNYEGWPDERMIRDVSRMQRLNLDFVLLSIAPEDVGDSHRRRRYERFFDMHRARGDWPPIAVWIERTAAYHVVYADECAGWLAAQFARDPGMFYMERGRLLVVLSPAIEAWPAYHPALSLQYASPYRNSWDWRPVAPGALAQQSFAPAFAVFAGWTGERAPGAGDEWEIPRYGGRSLIAAVRIAVGQRPARLCIAGWNDFQNGSFIEPNTLDGNRPYELLIREMQRFREGRP